MVNSLLAQDARAERKRSVARRVREQMEAAGITTNHADEWAKVAAAHKA